MDTLQSELERLSLGDAQDEKDPESLSGIIAAKNNKIGELEAELREFKSSQQAVIEAKDVKIAEQKELISSLIKNNESLAKSVELLGEMKKENGNMDMLQSDFDRLYQENAQYKKELNSMTTTMKVALAAKNKKIGELEVERRELKSSWESFIKDKDAKIGRLEVELRESKSSLQALLETKDVKISEQEKLISSLANKNEITDTTIRARFTDISKLTDNTVYSRPFTRVGINWRIGISKKDDYLTMYLFSNMKNDENMTCSAFAEFRLISHNSKSIYHFIPDEDESDLFRGNDNWGYPKFISFKDLFDKKKGYVKDDSILVAVVISAFPSN